MLDMVRQTYRRQYGAALAMLSDCITRCEETHWQALVGGVPFWHVAYHALFYADLYLSLRESEFERRPDHQENSQFFGRLPFPPHTPVTIDRIYDRQTLLAYVAHCSAKVKPTLARETEATLAGESGFPWLPITRAELHIYNIRHIQHHTGQLSATLVREQGAGAGWVGTRD
jgi:hypothetical protein